MSYAWFQQPEAQAVLNRLQPSDLSIVKRLAHGLGDKFIPDRFEWVVNNEEIDRRLDLFLDRATDHEVGYTFADSIGEGRNRWIETYERLPSVQAVLNEKFGDPNILFSYGLEQAERIWKHDPTYLIRMREQEAAMAAVKDFVTKDD